MSSVHSIDAEIEAAWSSYRTALADSLAVDPLIHAITAPYHGGGVQPAMSFSATRNHRLRCELSPDYLTSPATVDALKAAGWRWRASDMSFVYECARRLPDKAAAQAVWALREVWQVLHPAFLDSAGPIEPAADVIVRPRGRSQLQNLAADTVAGLLDGALDRDENGGVNLYIGAAASLLDARNYEPTLEFRTILHPEVPDHGRAHAVFDRGRGVWPGIEFTIEGGMAVATLHLECTVFVSRNLESALARWVDFMQDGHRQIVDELLDVSVLELPRALQCLLHLDDLNPKQVSKVCAFDRDDILEYIRLSTEQVIEWRQSAENSIDAEESAACTHDADAWARTKQQLVEALRYVVLDRTD